MTQGKKVLKNLLHDWGRFFFILLLVSSSILFGVAMMNFTIAWHNIDNAYNMKVLNEIKGTSYVDYYNTTHFCEPDECYHTGTDQIFEQLIKIVLSIFTMGYCTGILLLWEEK